MLVMCQYVILLSVVDYIPSIEDRVFLNGSVSRLDLIVFFFENVHIGFGPVLWYTSSVKSLLKYIGQDWYKMVSFSLISLVGSKSGPVVFWGLRPLNSVTSPSSFTWCPPSLIYGLCWEWNSHLLWWKLLPWPIWSSLNRQACLHQGSN